MHLSNTLGVNENFDSEGLQNIIANAIQMVLVGVPVLSPHAFLHVKPKLPLKVGIRIQYHV